MNTTRLNEEEIRIWHMWKSTFESVISCVAKTLSDCAEISDNDFGILDRLVHLGNGELRQQELVDSMEWSKSRLSHHLKRMEHRGLITRKPLGGSVQIIITSAGKSALDDSRPIRAKAIRKYFLAQLTTQDIESITNLAERINKHSSASCKAP